MLNIILIELELELSEKEEYKKLFEKIEVQLGEPAIITSIDESFFPRNVSVQFFIDKEKLELKEIINTRGAYLTGEELENINSTIKTLRNLILNHKDYNLIVEILNARIKEMLDTRNVDRNSFNCVIESKFDENRGDMKYYLYFFDETGNRNLLLEILDELLYKNEIKVVELNKMSKEEFSDMCL